MLKLYTCRSGVELHEEGQDFLAWTEEEKAEMYKPLTHFLFEVDEKYIINKKNFEISGLAEIEKFEEVDEL